MKTLDLYKKEKECANMICKAYFDLFQNGNKPTEPQIRIWVKNYVAGLEKNKTKKGPRGPYKKRYV